MKVQHGVAIVETLIAAPVVLWLGLAVLQWALVFHARSAVVFALSEAARAGAVSGADPQAIDRGLARGLAPFLGGAADAAGHLAAIAGAQGHVAAGRAGGWLLLRQLSPTAQSFEDWAEDDIDDFGRPDPSRRVIPNDNLTHRIHLTVPAGGVAGHRGDEPIGSRSGQTLADANLLKLELVYGVPLNVPFVGPLAAWALRIVDGCREPEARPVGTMTLAAPDAGAARDWACAFYDAIDERGRAVPRVPVRVSATMRMQSPARFSNDAVRGASAAAMPSPGIGRHDDAAPVASGNAAGHAPLVSAGPAPGGSATGGASGSGSTTGSTSRGGATADGATPGGSSSGGSSASGTPAAGTTVGTVRSLQFGGARSGGLSLGACDS